MKMPNPEVIIATVDRAVPATTRPRPGCPSNRMKAPSPRAAAPTKPICIAQKRFSKPLPKNATTTAMAAPSHGPAARRART